MEIRNPIVELKETVMWNYLNAIHQDYAKTAINFLNQITDILNSIEEVFPYYTRHDAHHGFRVLRRMN